MMNEIQLSRIDLNLLVLFDVLLRECHVGRAASRLHLTPSAVSHRLRRLRTLLHDPLFLRTSKGVVPTERALALREPIGQILGSVGDVFGLATPFDPALSTRRFLIGAPDVVLTSLALPLLRRFARHAPSVDVGLVSLMPTRRERSTDQPWQLCLDRVERRELDVAVLPVARVPRRFVARSLYQEDFVVAVRRGHPFAKKLTVKAFVAARHLLVSSSADPRGFVEELLDAHGEKRRVAMTVPTYAMTLDIVAGSDLLATLPRRFVTENRGRLAIEALELPIKRKAETLYAVTTRAAMADLGIQWLVREIEHLLQIDH
jgi:DNA-binding transcriptional LysR family regulator